MHKLTALTILVALVAVSVTAVALQEVQLSAKKTAMAKPDQLAQDLMSLSRHHQATTEAAERLADLYQALDRKVAELTELASAVDLKGCSDSQVERQKVELLEDAIAQLAEMQQSRNMEFLALQNQMQSESRRFQTVSNALKARHDSEMSTVRNAK